MDRLVDETEALGGTVNSPALPPSRPEPGPDQHMSILNSFTAGDLTGTVKACVCSCQVLSEDRLLKPFPISF